MVDTNYWSRITGSRLNRRTLVARGAVVGTGMAGIVLVGCSSSNNNNKATTAPSASASSAATAAGTARPGGTAAPSGAGTPARAAGTPARGAAAGLPNYFGNRADTVQKREAPTAKGLGGTTRSFGYDALPPDSYDPAISVFGPMQDVHARIFSKLLQYDDPINMSVSPDLAATIPEQPDQMTYVFKIDPNAKWQSKTPMAPNNPIAGQPVTAADVKFTFERQQNTKSASYGRFTAAGYKMALIDKIEAMDNSTLRITTKGAIGPFLTFVAGYGVSILSQKLITDVMADEIKSPAGLVGSGPFYLSQYEALKVAAYSKNTDWHGKDTASYAKGRPFLDQIIHTFMPQDDNTVEAALRGKQTDGTGWNQQDSADRVQKSLAGTYLWQQTITGSVRLNFACDHGPFKDPRVRQAVSIAFDRKAMGDALAQGFFKLQPTVSWPLTRWALPQDQLLKKPGYRTAQADRDADIKMAKQLLDAAGGPSIIGGSDFVMWYPNTPATIPAYYPQLQKNLKDTLGISWNGNLDETGYTKLLGPLLTHKTDMYFGYNNGLTDLDDWVWGFSSKAPPTNNYYGLSDPDLDAQIDKQRAAFDLQGRQTAGYAIQNLLLDKLVPSAESYGAVLNNLNWNYVKNYLNVPWFGYAHLEANVWLDQADPTFQGRPA